MSDLLNNERRLELFNRIAQIAARTAKAPVVLITLRVDRKLHVLGTHGLYLKNFDDSWCLGANLVSPTTMSFVPNVNLDPNLKGHPLLKAVPFARTLAHVPVQGEHSDVEAAITIINPEVRWPFNANLSAILTDLSMLIGDTLKTAGMHGQSHATAAVSATRGRSVSQPHQPGLHDSAATAPTPSLPPANGRDTAGQFLLATLNRRTSIRSRSDVSYVTLRSWSRSIKDHQITALKIVKEEPATVFVEGVALEMAEHIRSLFGVASFSSVVPVPCGHSKTENCLSVRIARQLASLLKIPFVEALQHSSRQGQSHPRRNAGLKAPLLAVRDKVESILLVDDVASSGRHIELAVKSLREISPHVSAIAWIGAA